MYVYWTQNFCLSLVGSPATGTHLRLKGGHSQNAPAAMWNLVQKPSMDWHMVGVQLEKVWFCPSVDIPSVNWNPPDMWCFAWRWFKKVTFDCQYFMCAITQRTLQDKNLTCIFLLSSNRLFLQNLKASVCKLEFSCYSKWPVCNLQTDAFIFCKKSLSEDIKRIQVKFCLAGGYSML